MKRLMSVAAFALVATNVTVWSDTGAADDLHQHGRRVSPATSTVQPAPKVEAPETTPSSSKPARAGDMMHRMESMPAHDLDTCCSAKTSDQGKGSHNH